MKLMSLTLSLSFILFTRVGFSDETLSFTNLADLITNNSISSIEQLLPLLPEEHRLNFVLMSSSASSQGASYLNPRVILYGKDAKLIIAFNGSSEQRGFNKIEAIEFKENTKEFEFREIDFSTGVISDKNPPKCLACHSAQSPRPNWAPYSIWTMGKRSIAYGFSDDHLTEHETSLFQTFKNKAFQDPRYKHLLFREGSENSPFLKTGDHRGDPRFRPNLDFTKKVFKLNIEKLIQKMKRHLGPSYLLYKSAILDLYIIRQTAGAHLQGDSLIIKIIDEILALNLFNAEEMAEIDAVKSPHRKASLINLILIKKSSLKPWDIDMNFMANQAHDPEELNSYATALTFGDGRQSALDALNKTFLREVIQEYPGVEHVIPFKRESFPKIKMLLSRLTGSQGTSVEDRVLSFIDQDNLERYEPVLSYIKRGLQEAAPTSLNCSKILSSN